MSRIGKLPLELPAGVTLTSRGREIVVKGPKGEVAMQMPLGAALKEDDGKYLVERESNSKQSRSSQGTLRSLLGNAVAGVQKEYTRTLEIVGVGYGSTVRGRTLSLRVGYANEIELEIPDGVQVTTPSAIQIVVASCDKQKTGQLAARIRKVRPPEPYNGKGIRYLGERIVKKAGKSFASAG